KAALRQPQSSANAPVSFTKKKYRKLVYLYHAYSNLEGPFSVSQNRKLGYLGTFNFVGIFVLIINQG
ncbi:hypothetical protein ABEY41_20075, partial [Peribacillus butanolivorans]|uniref:hypothetical protein n=1 Tax=Peribacillus butanolivorans TaxID=421767 RepID=UPI003D2D8277